MEKRSGFKLSHLLFLFCVLHLIVNCKYISNEENKDFEIAIEKFKKEGLHKLNDPKNGLPYLATKNFDPTWDELDLEIITIPSFQFLNQNKNSVTEKNLNNRITIVCFFYTRCGGYCPLVMRQMEKIRKAFINDETVYLLSFSVTPDYDTPEVLNKYTKTTGFGKFHWDLITGEKEKIYKIAREVFNADTTIEKSKSKDDFIHSEHVYLLDSMRRFRGIYDGNVSGDIDRIIEDIKNLKNEKK